MAAKKPAAKKPATPRTPSTGVRKPMASPAPTRKSGITVVMPNGSTVGIKDIGKVKPTPKPKPMPSQSQWSSKEYDAILKKAQKNARKK